MDAVLIGSMALYEHGLHNLNDCKDVDLIVKPEYLPFLMDKYRASLVESTPLSSSKWKLVTGPHAIRTGMVDGRIYDIEIAWPGSSGAALIDLLEDDYSLIQGRDDYFKWIIPSMQVLYALKLSHKYLKNSPHFEKTMDSIEWFEKRGQALENDKLYAWLEEREAETYDYSHPNLSQSKSDFFSGDGLTYTFDHDSIHESVSRMSGNTKPAYLLYKHPEEEVKCSRTLFFEACYAEDRLRGVYEEAIVLALERSQIPHPDSDPYWSFQTALQKVCTSITSGWFREYAWNNYRSVLDLYDPRYVEKFYRDVASGKVKLHEVDIDNDRFDSANPRSET